MRLIDVISRVDELKPNSISSEIKTEWVTELANMIRREVWIHNTGSFSDVVYDYSENPEMDIEISKGYEDIYMHYLSAKIDYCNAEYGRYNNSKAMFDSAYDEYKRFIRRTVKPEQKNSFKAV